MEFKDKVVVVTGGGSGIGLETCFAFLEEGAHVLCIDIDTSTARSQCIFRTFMNHILGSICFIESDILNAVKSKKAIERILKEYGRIDVVINNAAIQPLESYVPIHKLSGNLWDRILGVNLKGYFLMAKHCVPSMLKHGGGVIINIASVTAFAASKNIAAYAASKAGIISLTRSIALEYGDKNIRTVAICPGTIDTPLVRRTLSAQTHGMTFEEAKEKLGKVHPIGRVGTAQEVAATVLFCASSRASFMTGSAVTVDGGLSAKGAWAVE